MKRLFVALAVLAPLGGYVAWMVTHPPPKPHQRWVKVFPLERSRVREVEVAWRGGPHLVMRRQGDSWWMVRPRRYEVDPERMESLLDSVLFPVEIDTISQQPGDLSQFGLDPPRARLTVGDARDRRTLLLGDYTPTRTCSYVKWAGSSRVFTVGALLMDDLRIKATLCYLRARASSSATSSTSSSASRRRAASSRTR